MDQCTITTTASNSNGSAIAKSEAQNKRARFIRLTFPEPGKILLKIGPGDHTSDNWEIDKDQLRGLLLDGLPELLKR